MSGLLYWSGYRRDNNKKFKLQTAERSESKETLLCCGLDDYQKNCSVEKQAMCDWEDVKILDVLKCYWPVWHDPYWMFLIFFSYFIFAHLKNTITISYIFIFKLNWPIISVMSDFGLKNYFSSPFTTSGAQVDTGTPEWIPLWTEIPLSPPSASPPSHPIYTQLQLFSGKRGSDVGSPRGPSFSRLTLSD